MNLEQLEIFLWQKNLLQNEVNSMNKSLDYFFTARNEKMIRKFNGYQILTEKMVNFSTLSPAIYEAREDFDEIICLLLGGHYKACLLLLRSHLELANGIIRAIKNNQPQTNFYQKREIKGERKFGTKALQVPIDWQEHLTDLFDELSKYTHASGKSNSHKTFVSLPQPTFIEESFGKCLNLINKVVDHNAGLLKYCFKPGYWKQDLLKNLFGKDFGNSFNYDYEEKSIEYLYKNIDNSLIKNYLDSTAV